MLLTGARTIFLPHRIEKWQRGAEGERLTARALKPLESAGWTIRHDLAGQYGNIDHLVVGTSGVFLLETKNWAGCVRVADGKVIIVSPEDPTDEWTMDVGSRVRGAAFGTSEAIKSLVGRGAWVQSVVVIWGRFDQGLIEDSRVVYLHGDRLQNWLTSQRDRISPADVNAIVARLG